PRALPCCHSNRHDNEAEGDHERTHKWKTFRRGRCKARKLPIGRSVSYRLHPRNVVFPPKKTKPPGSISHRAVTFQMGPLHYANSSCTGLPLSIILMSRPRVLMFSLRGLILSA